MKQETGPGCEQKGGGISIKEFIFAITITSLVFVFVSSIPILGAFAALLAPLPLLYYYSRFGRTGGILVFAVSLAVAAVVLTSAGIGFDVRYLFVLGCAGPILSEVLRKNYGIEKTVILSASCILVTGLLLLIYYSMTRGMSPFRLIELSILDMVRTTVNAYPDAGVTSEQIELIKKSAEQIAGVMTYLFPSIMIVGSVFVAWVNVMEGRLLFRFRKMWFPDFGDLTCWKIHDKFIWLVIASVVFVMLPVTGIRIVGFNMLVIQLFAYMLQGLAIVAFWLNRKKVPWFLRLFAYAFIFAQQFLLLIVIGLGMVDVWADFRKLNRAQ